MGLYDRGYMRDDQHIKKGQSYTEGPSESLSKTPKFMFICAMVLVIAFVIWQIVPFISTGGSNPENFVGEQLKQYKHRANTEQRQRFYCPVCDVWLEVKAGALIDLAIDGAKGETDKKKPYYAYQEFMKKHSQCGDGNDIHLEVFYEGDPRFDSLDPMKEGK